LQGGEGNDRFHVMGSMASIHGGEGQDLVDYSDHVGDLIVTLAGEGAEINPNTDNVGSIEGVIGNNDGSRGLSHFSMISRESGDLEWIIGSFDGIADGVNDGVVVIDGGKRIWFENFNVIEGSAGNDHIRFERYEPADGTLMPAAFIGYINGNGGHNTFDATDSASQQVVRLGSMPFTADDGLTDSGGDLYLSSFQDITASSAAGNRLVADSIANTWEIDGSGQGLLNGSIAFRGFSELEGGAAADAFTIEYLAGLEFIDGGDAPSEIG